MIALDLDRLAETAQFGRALIERLPSAGLIIADRDLCVRLLDGEALREVREKVALGRPLAETMGPEAWEVLGPRYRAALDGGVQSFDYAGQDGQRHWALRMSAVRDPAAPDQVVGVMVLVEDVTDRVHERERRTEEERLQRSILEVLSEGVVVLGLHGELVQANQAAQCILGRELDPADADWWLRTEARLSDGTPLPVASPGAEVLSSGRAVRDVTISVVRGDGVRRLLHVNYQPLLDDGGAVRGMVVSFHDITDQEEAREHLRASATRLREAHQLALLASWEWDVQRDRLTLWQGLTEGGDRGVESDMSIDALMSTVLPEDRETIRRVVEDLRAGRADDELLRYRYWLPGGRAVWVETRARAVRAPDGTLLAIRGTSQDVTSQQQAAAELERAYDFLQSTMDSLSAQISVLDERGDVLATNAAWERCAIEDGRRDIRTEVGGNYLAACDALAGDPHADRAARGLRAILAGTASEFVMEYPLRVADGDRWFLLRADRHRSQGPTRVVVQHIDVSERRRAERELRSARDYLHAVTHGMAEGMCTLDLEGRVVYVNRAAERILGWSAKDLMGRRLCEAVHPGREHEPFQDSSEDAFTRSDGSAVPVEYTAAPFETPEGIRGTALLFSDISERRAREAELQRDLEDLAWVARINEAIEQDRLVLHAQPIVELATGVTVQHELLLRMRELDGSLVAPGLFLPAAERYGLIREIDRWVVRRGAALAALGHAVEINVSAESLGDPEFATTFERELELSGADCSSLVVELTETALLRDDAAGTAFVERLQRMGCRLALDDFGTGYGGFTYLKRLQVDYLKIDIEFVRDLPRDPASQHVVRAVVHLAQGFGQRTVAEGVEDAETLELLRELGVDYVQGYHFGRPAPVEEVLGLSGRRSRAPSAQR